MELYRCAGVYQHGAYHLVSKLSNRINKARDDFNHFCSACCPSQSEIYADFSALLMVVNLILLGSTVLQTSLTKSSTARSQTCHHGKQEMTVALPVIIRTKAAVNVKCDGL